MPANGRVQNLFKIVRAVFKLKLTYTDTRFAHIKTYDILMIAQSARD